MRIHAASLFLSVALILLPIAVTAQTDEPNLPLAEQVVQPQIDRRAVKPAHIDVDDLEFGVYAGILSMENFPSQSVRGLRLAYHVSEDFFLEGTYAKSIITDEFFRSRAFPLIGFDKQEEDLNYYNISLGVNLLPGEIFLGTKWAMASALYIIGGVGRINFAHERFPAVNYGLGYRILTTDWFAVHFDMRDHIYYSDLPGTNKRTHNFEVHTGVTVYF